MVGIVVGVVLITFALISFSLVRSQKPAFLNLDDSSLLGCGALLFIVGVIALLAGLAASSRY